MFVARLMIETCMHYLPMDRWQSPESATQPANNPLHGPIKTLRNIYFPIMA
jgi:hypothetical protein